MTWRKVKQRIVEIINDENGHLVIHKIATGTVQASLITDCECSSVMSAGDNLENILEDIVKKYEEKIAQAN